MFDSEAIRAVLARHPAVRGAIVFGSRARGTARSDSDLDLGVGGREIDTLALAGDLALALGVEADVVSLELDQVSIPLLAAVVREGKAVHDAPHGTVASWWARALAALELDLPWYERMRKAYLDRLAAGRGLDGG